MYLHQVKHLWVGYEDGRGGVVDAGAMPEEPQAKAHVLTAKNVEPKEAVMWMQMQREARVAACVDSTSRTVEVWGPMRQVLALALYVGAAVQRSREAMGRRAARTRTQACSESKELWPWWIMERHRGIELGRLYMWCRRRLVPQVQRTRVSST